MFFKIGKVKKVLKGIRPDLLHAHYATSYGLVGALTGFHPFAVTAHGSDILVSAARSLFHRIAVKYTMRKADWPTVVAEHMRAKARDIGMDVSRMETIIFGIAPDIFNTTGKNLPQDEFRIVTTRSFEPVYNHGLFISSVVLLKDRIPNLRVEMIGDGAERAEMEGRVRKQGLNDIIRFPGRVALSGLVEALKNSHVYVSTSLSDGTSISLLEAMACGTFPVVSDIPANRPWISDGENGFLFPLNDPGMLAERIFRLYSNFDTMHRRALQRNGELIRERAVWETNMKKIEEKYLQLIQYSDRKN